MMKTLTATVLAVSMASWLGATGTATANEPRLDAPRDAALEARTETLAGELEALLDWLVGEFDNTRQVARGENLLLTQPPDETRVPGLLYPVFARVTAPALGDHVIYLQWPVGAPDGRLQRQRIWSFQIDLEGNALLMDFYTLREPERWRDAHLAPEQAMLEVSAADVVPYPVSCRLPFRRHADVFIGEIPRGDCRIVSQETRTEMTINARVIVGRDQVWYDESGVRPDGGIVFQVPASGAYQFRRRTAAQ
jgi:hypothetical protein